MPTPLETIVEDLIPGAAGVFRLMALAESTIETRFPIDDFDDRRAWASHTGPLFRCAQPPEPIQQMAEFVYTAYVSEMCDRFAADEDPAPATDAELMAVMHETSLSAPLNNEGMAVYGALLRRVAGRAGDYGVMMKVLDAFPVDGTEPLDVLAKAAAFDGTKEVWSGQVRDELARLRRKYVTKRSWS